MLISRENLTALATFYHTVQSCIALINVFDVAIFVIYIHFEIKSYLLSHCMYMFYFTNIMFLISDDVLVS